MKPKQYKLKTGNNTKFLVQFSFDWGDLGVAREKVLWLKIWMAKFCS